MSPNELYIAAGGAIFSGIVWCIRLEGKVKGQDRLIEALEKRIEAQDERINSLKEKYEGLELRIMQELSCIREALARMEGRLDFGSHKSSP